MDGTCWARCGRRTGGCASGLAPAGQGGHLPNPPPPLHNRLTVALYHSNLPGPTPPCFASPHHGAVLHQLQKGPFTLFAARIGRCQCQRAGCFTPHNIFASTVCVHRMCTQHCSWRNVTHLQHATSLGTGVLRAYVRPSNHRPHGQPHQGVHTGLHTSQGGHKQRAYQAHYQAHCDTDNIIT